MGGGESKEVNPCLNPLLLVSGIGGTMLNATNKTTNLDTRVWVRLFLANYDFKKYAFSFYHADTGYTECINPDIEITVPKDDYGLYAIDNLDPSWFTKLFRLSDVNYFHDIIDMLVGCGYEKGTTLFGYGYDFRQSIRIDKIIDGLREKLKTAYKSADGKKVDIISHSMGGLVIRCFLSLFPDEFEKYVNKWICIACPFQGAPGCINDTLLTGLQFVFGFQSYFFVSRWNMHQLLIECPSIYEMLPNPGFQWKHQPVIQVWRKVTDDDADAVVKLETYYSTECYDLFENALVDNEITYNGETVPLPFNNDILDWALQTRAVLDSAKLPESVSFYNIYGTEYSSPFNICYGTEDSPISDLSEICDIQGKYSFVDGDGTVPTESAIADGFNATERAGVKATHRDLLCDKNVLELIMQWLDIVSLSKKRSKSTTKVMDAGFAMKQKNEH
ncbi:Phospholipase A2 [Zostera marina]|uniref:Phospholipase A2 n=1 Tax=Zostera marina TaxID=29655 RepID=A0A0K9Q1W5_ZOSMR|nr:Phospholipase A2 [Zostera marina]